MPVDKLTKQNCCGCNACGDVCPTQAITFETDIEGFWYPRVDYSKCIGCELCTKICPDINIESLKKNDFPRPAGAIAAINNNLKDRWNSTSGGAFSAFAEYIYGQEGFVGGAVYTEDFHVVNYISDDKSDLERLRSSKYLESYAEGFYKKVKECLKTGRKVLVCGTPCQMAGLRSFLRKDYDNLIIVDFICRGVNSPKVYRKYLDELESRYGSPIVRIKAKNKELGWRNLTRKVTFANGESYYGVLMDDDFRRGYHTNVYCRPSCYSCVFKGFPRMSDITIGDFWGIEKFAPNLDNNIGTSEILINSEKGRVFWELVKDRFEYVELPLKSAFAGNIALFNAIEAPTIDREKFFEDLDKGGFAEVVKKYFPLKKHSRAYRGKFREFASITKELFRLYGFNIRAFRNFYWINKRENTNSNIPVRDVIYPMPGTVMEIHPSAIINVHAPLKLGYRPIAGLSLPGCLNMGPGTTLNINGGPLDRYGRSKAPYLLKNGCYVEIINGGTLTIGSGAANVGLTVMCAKEVIIGNGVRIGRNVSIRDWNGPHVIVSSTYRNHAPVHIEDHVWLCTGCSIMPGVTIGKGAVVGANAVVTRDVPPYSLVVGSPAKVVKSDIEWY